MSRRQARGFSGSPGADSDTWWGHTAGCPLSCAQSCLTLCDPMNRIIHGEIPFPTVPLWWQKDIPEGLWGFTGKARTLMSHNSQLPATDSAGTFRLSERSKARILCPRQRWTLAEIPFLTKSRAAPEPFHRQLATPDLRGRHASPACGPSQHHSSCRPMGHCGIVRAQL